MNLQNIPYHGKSGRTDIIIIVFVLGYRYFNFMLKLKSNMVAGLTIDVQKTFGIRSYEYDV